MQAYLDKYVGLAKTTVTAACRGDRRLVANRDAVLRWAETAANLDILAAGPCTPATIGPRFRPGCEWQVSTSLRFTDHPGDVKWDEADPTYSLEAADRGA